MTSPQPFDPPGIFASIPKSVTIGTTAYAAHIEYADRGKTVDQVLKEAPIAIKLRYYGDRKDRDATPGNKQYKREISGQDLKYTYGEKRRVTLSINIHVKDTEAVPAGIVIDAYCELLKTWVLRDLPAIIEVVDDTWISDLTYLENKTERRQMDIILRYDNTYQKTVGSIETVDDPEITIS
ncbi:hypothetical protein [Methanoregula sp.]|uniref:hypothetical protein n=1 Tax=Methanoregula sp. TaxID=2052170 RepID=UPI000CC70706|nr:hypothetical protein [Methanoregula sp.]PKG32189.1 MAG: hypothetical protein CW742_09465 [Methanoregula sp.]